MEYDKTIPVRVPEETRLALDAEAEKRGVKLAWLVRSILGEYAAQHNLLTVRVPAIQFTGKGDEIGEAFPALKGASLPDVNPDQDSHDYKES